MARNRTYNSYADSSYYSRYYSGTSEAHDVSAVPQRKRVTHRKKVRRQQYEHAIGSIIYPRFIYVVLSVVFVGCLLSVFAYAFVWSHTRNIVSLQNEISLVKENIALLEADSTFNYDLRKVEEIAKTRLQMSLPEQHQIIYIDVPNESYITQYTHVSTEEAPANLSSVVNYFFKEWSNETAKKN